MQTRGYIDCEALFRLFLSAESLYFYSPTAEQEIESFTRGERLLKIQVNNCLKMKISIETFEVLSKKGGKEIRLLVVFWTRKRVVALAFLIALQGAILQNSFWPSIDISSLGSEMPSPFTQEHHPNYGQQQRR